MQEDPELKLMLVRVVHNIPLPVAGGFGRKKRERAMDARQRRQRDHTAALKAARSTEEADVIDFPPIRADRHSMKVKVNPAELKVAMA